MNGAAIYDIENQECLSSVPICKTSFQGILDTEQKTNLRGGYILTQNNQLSGIITVSPTLLLQTYLKTSDLTLIHSNLEQIDVVFFVAIFLISWGGNSTLLYILAGLVKPTKGEVY